jgi:hypothetical protein
MLRVHAEVFSTCVINSWHYVAHHDTPEKRRRAGGFEELQNAAFRILVVGLIIIELNYCPSTYLE